MNEAKEVNEWQLWHHVHDRHYQIITWFSFVYTISYLYIVYDVVFDIDDIVHDIVYDNVLDVWYLKLSKADVLGRVPLIQFPWYLNGNSVNIIPRNFRGKIPKEATADSRPKSGIGSRLFEINMWMWRYGRNFSKSSQISVEQAVELRKKRVQDSAGNQGTWRWDSFAQEW